MHTHKSEYCRAQTVAMVPLARLVHKVHLETIYCAQTRFVRSANAVPLINFKQLTHASHAVDCTDPKQWEKGVCENVDETTCIGTKTLTCGGKNITDVKCMGDNCTPCEFAKSFITASSTQIVANLKDVVEVPVGKRLLAPWKSKCNLFWPDTSKRFVRFVGK